MSSWTGGRFFIQASLLLAISLFFIIGCEDECSCPEINEDPIELIEEHTILSSSYLNHRFFRLDLPASQDCPVSDYPGRDVTTLRIDPNSIQVFQLMNPEEPGPNDVQNMAVYLDTTGVFWSTEECPEQDFFSPYLYGERWRELDMDITVDTDGEFEAIDLGHQMAPQDVLGIIYNVVDTSGGVVFKIGDHPGTDNENRVALPGEENLYYKMKLLKAPENMKERFPFYYVLRNIYYLGFGNIDISSFDLQIERNDDSLLPGQDENQIPYIQIFGLDQCDEAYSLNPDGVADFQNEVIFDMRQGLLRFPQKLHHPFSAGEEAYETYAGSEVFQWEGTYLSENQAPLLYDPETLSLFYPAFDFFKIVARYPKQGGQM